MYSKLKSLLRIFLYFSLIFWAMSSGNPFAKPAAKGENPKESVSTQTTQPAKNNNNSLQVSADKNEIHAIKEKGMDKAGQRIGQRIDKFSDAASSKLGKWIDTEIFLGITWLKLLFCLLLTFLVILLERMLRWVINIAIRKIPPHEDIISWRKQFLESLSSPLSLFVWSYGIYGALSPLYTHFHTKTGENLVHLVAQKAAYVGATIAIIWFILRLVEVLDIYLKRWAAATESTINDMLVPIVGKTTRLFIILIGAMIIIQNMTGLKIGPLLASLGIGGLAVALAAKDSIANFFGTLTILFDKPFQVGQRITIDQY
ncbi:MAG: mechanosensitive ion channel domain-containing protein, partial [Desulfobacterales bacterium]